MMPRKELKFKTLRNFFDLNSHSQNTNYRWKQFSPSSNMEDLASIQDITLLQKVQWWKVSLDTFSEKLTLLKNLIAKKGKIVIFGAKFKSLACSKKKKMEESMEMIQV